MTCHIVMTGTDTSVFGFGLGTDTRTRLMDYATELDRQCPGSRLTYLCLSTTGAAQSFTENNFQAELISGSYLSRRWKLYRRLLDLQKQARIDVISTQNLYEDCWTALLLKLRWKTIAVVGQEHNDPFERHNFSGGFLKRLALHLRHTLSLIALPYLDGLRTVSPAVAEQYKAYAPSLKMSVIPVAISLQPLPRTETPETPVLLYVGRLAPQKNLETWLTVAADVAHALPTARFHIVGDGPLRHSLEEYCKTLGLEQTVTFHGWLSPENLARNYADASILLVPSWYEGYGRVVLEALVCSLPVIASDTAGPRFILEGTQAGLLFKPDDIKGMSAATIELLNAPDKRDSMRHAGRNVTARFSPSRLRQEWIKFLIDAKSNISKETLK